MTSSRPILGQNFLVDEDWQKKIVDLFEPEGVFGEIGPGHGAITKHLLKKYSAFAVFEKDQKLAAEQKRNSALTVIEGDYLDWDYRLNGKDVRDFSLIGNLPYEAGTAIVKSAVEHSDQVVYFLFLLQKEVTERLCAKPHTRDFGSLTVFVQGQFIVEALDIIPPEAFSPKPKVFSQLVRGRVRKAGAHPKTKEYQKFVQQAFSQKRKTLRNCLKSSVSAERIDQLFHAFQFKPTVRAEEIEVDLWPKVFEELKRDL